MHENRETSLVSAEADRSGKANSHKPDEYAREESRWDSPGRFAGDQR